MKTIKITQNQKIMDWMRVDLTLNAFEEDKAISFKESKSKSYNRVYLKKTDNEKIDIEFLKLINAIDFNLIESSLCNKYADVFYDLVGRHISGKLVESKTKLTRNELINKRLIDENNNNEHLQFDIELFVKPVSKEVLVNLIKLNEELIESNLKQFASIKNFDKTMIEKLVINSKEQARTIG